MLKKTYEFFQKNAHITIYLRSKFLVRDVITYHVTPLHALCTPLCLLCYDTLCTRENVKNNVVSKASCNVLHVGDIIALKISEITWNEKGLFL